MQNLLPSGVFKMEMYYPVDIVMRDELSRLPVSDIQELHCQFNCNLVFSEENEVWFDMDNTPEHISIVSESDQLNWDLENIWGN